MVRAKVTCENVANNEVKFKTVAESQKNDENTRFSLATPSGEMRLSIDNPAALSQFTAGESYYVDFSPAPK